jgi:hypothetical protein
MPRASSTLRSASFLPCSRVSTTCAGAVAAIT